MHTAPTHARVDPAVEFDGRVAGGVGVGHDGRRVDVLPRQAAEVERVRVRLCPLLRVIRLPMRLLEFGDRLMTQR